MNLFPRHALLLLCMVSTCYAQAQTLELGDSFYGIDHELRLVVSNQNVELLNYLYQEGVSSIELDDEAYVFTPAVDQLEVGTEYVLSKNGTEYKLYFTSLPLFFIEMNRPLVNDESRHAKGKFTTSDGNILNSDLGLKIRGGFSQTLPKKSLRVEFWMDEVATQTRSVKLLDLRKDDDWILLPMYNEPLRLRNATAHMLWQDLHIPYYLESSPKAESGTRSRYIEVFLNSEYRGVYLLTERVDRKQLQLGAFSDSTGVQGELYKGFDYASGLVTFDFLGFFNNKKRTWDGYEMKYPKGDMKTNWSRLFDLKAFVLQSPDSTFGENIDMLFHLGNAVDYFIYINLIYAQDNVGKNAFVARYQTDDPYFYVPWDLDGILGNDWMGQRWGEVPHLLSNGLYDRLLENCYSSGFGELLKTRWTELRASLITPETMTARIVENHNLLSSNGVYDREEIAWADFKYKADDLNYTTNWIAHRVKLMDEFVLHCCDDSSGSSIRQPHFPIDIYPNPAYYQLAVRHTSFDVGSQYSIRDSFGRIAQSGFLGIHTTFIDVSSLAVGFYLLELKDGQKMVRKKWVKN